ncbi:Serine/threonine-protein phosphatase 7 long form-like protein [Hordeum vulgare]|nr:Serine/threonine-protein phosphatase 7 long form-like protein [Hordeum vulgare]
MEQYARDYRWFLLREVVFPDCSRENSLWIYLDFLKDWDEGYNLGSVGLAYICRSLDDATHRMEETSRCNIRTPSGGQLDTGGSDLHLQNNQSNIDWGETHDQYVRECNEWKTHKDVKRTVVDWDDYEDHMWWYNDDIRQCTMTTSRMKPTMTVSES